MSAPRLSLRASRTVRHLLVTALALVVAAGCAVPGAGRLQGPPEGLAPVLDYVTADALTVTLLDGDPASKRWEGIRAATGSGDDNAALTAHWAGFLGDGVSPRDAATWAGPLTGAARYTIDRASTDLDDASMLWFADVRSRTRLTRWLGTNGWKRARGDLGGERGARFDVWLRRGAGDDGETTALGVSNDALVGARDRDALSELLAAADRYALPERKAIAEYALDATEATPLAVLFRTDLLRTQARRFVEDDPATLEMARWLTSTKLLLAARDGWFGLAPVVDASRRSVRVVGKVDWVADLAPDLRLRPADRAELDEFVPEASLAVAVRDPGQFAQDTVNAITRGGNQFATEDDVEGGSDRVELLELLDDLDGQSGVAWDARRGTILATVRTTAEDAVERVRAAFQLADLPAQVIDAQPGVGFTVGTRIPEFGPYDAGATSPTPAAPVSRDRAQLDALFAPAGTPPSDPIAWLWQGATSCDGPTAGWITYDRVERFTFSFDVSLEADPSASAPCGRANLLDGVQRIVGGGARWGVDRARAGAVSPPEAEVTAPTPRR